MVGLLAIKSVSDQLQAPLFYKQAIASFIGIAAMVIIMMLDYKDFRFLSIPIFIGTVALLIYVLIAGVGLEETGTQGWIDLGFISSNLRNWVKSHYVLLRLIFEKIKQGDGGINYVWLFGSAGFLIGLVLLQPDLGTAVVYVLCWYA